MKSMGVPVGEYFVNLWENGRRTKIYYDFRSFHTHKFYHSLSILRVKFKFKNSLLGCMNFFLPSCVSFFISYGVFIQNPNQYTSLCIVCK